VNGTGVDEGKTRRTGRVAAVNGTGVKTAVANQVKTGIVNEIGEKSEIVISRAGIEPVAPPAIGILKAGTAAGLKAVIGIGVRV
jgi:hypothetical protein